jgi:hypothetical protein
MQQLSKTDIARRQLVTAIRLFFDDSDPVSVYTLAANAWEVIDVLCNSNDIDSISNQSRSHIPIGEDLKRDYINSPYRNFFKHADRDVGAMLDGFDDQKCDSIIYLAAEDYMRFKKESPLEFQVFQLWYLALFPEKVTDDALAKLLGSIEVYFPKLRELARWEQKRIGRQVLLRAIGDAVPMSDPGVESSFDKVQIFT